MVTEGILNYKIKNKNGDIFFPSELGNYITFDYATGMGGTVVFLKRFLNVLKGKNEYTLLP